MRRRVALGAVLLALAGCGDSVTEPGPRVPFAPPGVYADLYDVVKDCSGRTGSMNGIDWFLTSTFSSAGVLGQWRENREITLRVDVWNDFQVVKHEMLHDLLRGDGDHRDPAWAACDLPVGVEG